MVVPFCTPVTLPPGRVTLCTSPSSTRVDDRAEHDGDVRALHHLLGDPRRQRAQRQEQIDLLREQPAHLALDHLGIGCDGAVIHVGDALALHVAELAHPRLEAGDDRLQDLHVVDDADGVFLLRPAATGSEQQAEGDREHQETSRTWRSRAVSYHA